MSLKAGLRSCEGEQMPIVDPLPTCMARSPPSGSSPRCLAVRRSLGRSPPVGHSPERMRRIGVLQAVLKSDFELQRHFGAFKREFGSSRVGARGQMLPSNQPSLGNALETLGVCEIKYHPMP